MKASKGKHQKPLNGPKLRRACARWVLEVVLGPVQVLVLLHVVKRVGVLLDEGGEAICVRVGEDVRQAEGDHGAMRRPAQPARVLEASLCEHALEQGGVVGGVEEGLRR